MSRLPRKERKRLLDVVAVNIQTLKVQKFGREKGSSKAAAEALGKLPQQWYPWEKGIRMPNAESLKMIANLFGVTSDYLLTDHSPNQKRPQMAAAETPASVMEMPSTTDEAQTTGMTLSEPLPTLEDGSVMRGKLETMLRDSIQYNVKAMAKQLGFDKVKTAVKLEMIIDIDFA